MLEHTCADILPVVPADAVTPAELAVLDLAGITYTRVNDAYHLKFWSAGAVDLSVDAVVIVDNPQGLIDQIDNDYPATSLISESWVREILIELSVHVAGYGNTPYEGRLVEGENFALAVLKTVARRIERRGHGQTEWKIRAHQIGDPGRLETRARVTSDRIVHCDAVPHHSLAHSA